MTDTDGIEIKDQIKERTAPWTLVPDTLSRVKAEGYTYGHDAACVVLWDGEKSLTDQNQALEVAFDIPDYIEGSAAYLLVETEHVQYPYNDVYVNKHWAGSLRASMNAAGHGGIEPFALAKELNAGRNCVYFIARDRLGGQAVSGSEVPPEYAGLSEYPNIDNIRLKNAKLVYATSKPEIQVKPLATR